MKRILMIAASCLLATVASAQSPQYTVTDLGPAGTPFSQALWTNLFGLVGGFFTAPDGTSHAALWLNGEATDISQPGLGGPNSIVLGVNAFSQVAGVAETPVKDPNNENFCGFPTGLQCQAFLWRFGAITAFPTLGGTNSGFGAINNLGEVAGYAETSHVDPECAGYGPGPHTLPVNGTGPQLLDYEAVIWGPKPGKIRQLALLPGDTVSIALGINDLGQAVGISGRCGNTILPGFTAGPHAVLWDSDGSVHDIGNFGGNPNPQVLGLGNGAVAINNRGQVTGELALPPITNGDCPGDHLNSACYPFHPFIWTREKGLQDLGLLPGGLVGSGLGMNDLGEIVGASITAPGAQNGFPSAFLWRNGVMYDLNELVAASTPMHLATGFSIDDFGRIAGFGFVTSGPDAGSAHAFLAVPK